MVIDCTNLAPAKKIEKKFLEGFQSLIAKVEFILLNTGWSEHWGTPKYLGDFPVLSEEAARFLTDFKLKGIGFDTISADPMDSKDLPVHKILLNNQVIIIENLTNLESLPKTDFKFACFPLKVKSGDGSPVRAVGIMEEKV